MAFFSSIHSLSSSAQSTPERLSGDASQSTELVQEIVTKEHATSSKSKVTEQSKSATNQDPKKPPLSSKDRAFSRKRSRKGKNPIRIPPMDQSLEFGNSNAWVCKNTACKAKLYMDDVFCKRCSCCICHKFDDNKDPSLWFVCSSESKSVDYCGLSCHIECALESEKAGVVNRGQLMQLDGSYCCFVCGKVSCILGCWKKQLTKAKEARRVNFLCKRIFLSFIILNGTSRHKELHKLVEDATAKLETEVGPLNGDSAKKNEVIARRLSIWSEVHRLCSLAVAKADEWLATVSNSHPIRREGSLPAACKIHFEEVTCSSVVIILIEMPSSSTDDIKGYKLWYCKSRDEYSKDPISDFPKNQRRILISNLEPCTEYSFRIKSYNETVDLGHSEAKCFTKSLKIIQKKLGSKSANFNNNTPQTEVNVKKEQGCFEGLPVVNLEKSYEGDDVIKPVEAMKHQSRPAPLELDLNIASVPDLNEELFPPFESPRTENIDTNGLAGSDGIGNSRDWANGELPAVNSRGETCRKRAVSAIGDTLECDNLAIGSPFVISQGFGNLDENLNIV